jgi:hypothetical protein
VFPFRVHYYTKDLGDDRWAVHYYAAIQGQELVTRCDLIPAEPDLMLSSAGLTISSIHLGLAAFQVLEAYLILEE